MADYSRQRDFICSHVLKKPPTRSSKMVLYKSCNNNNNKPVVSERRRAANFTYFFTVAQEHIRVCKQVFLATLNIGERTVRYALDRSNGVGISNKDHRGKHTPRIKKSEEVHKRVHDHITSFPCLESHYSRASSSKNTLRQI